MKRSPYGTSKEVWDPCWTSISGQPPLLAFFYLLSSLAWSSSQSRQVWIFFPISLEWFLSLTISSSWFKTLSPQCQISFDLLPSWIKSLRISSLREKGRYFQILETSKIGSQSLKVCKQVEPPTTLGVLWNSRPRWVWFHIFLSFFSFSFSYFQLFFVCPHYKKKKKKKR